MRTYNISNGKMRSMSLFQEEVMFRGSSNLGKPIARTEGLSVTTSGDETLVYDRDHYVIHRLSAELASVWRLADGTRDSRTLATAAGLSVSNVERFIRSLVAMNLVQGDGVQKNRLSRRLFVGGAAATAAAGTFVPAAAHSHCTGYRAVCYTYYDSNTGRYVDVRQICGADGWFCPPPPQ